MITALSPCKYHLRTINAQEKTPKKKQVTDCKDCNHQLPLTHRRGKNKMSSSSEKKTYFNFRCGLCKWTYCKVFDGCSFFDTGTSITESISTYEIILCCCLDIIQQYKHKSCYFASVYHHKHLNMMWTGYRENVTHVWSTQTKLQFPPQI